MTRNPDRDGTCVSADRDRIADLDAIPFPDYHRVDLERYEGYGMMTSRGCPYQCTFCSVAPVWSHKSFSRSPGNIVEEMKRLNAIEISAGCYNLGSDTCSY